MEAAIDDLMNKVKAIAQGPNADLLRKLVDVLYQQAEQREEYDEEPFSAEDLAAIKEGEEALKRGEFISLEEYEKERGM
jgi:predicted transcriptional regulator